MKFKKIIKSIYYKLKMFISTKDLPEAFLLIDEQGYVQSANNMAIELFNQQHNNFELVNIKDLIKNGLDITKKYINSNNIVVVELNTDTSTYGEMLVKKISKGYLVSIRKDTKSTKEVDKTTTIKKTNFEKNSLLTQIEEDLNTPLASIKGFSQGLLNGLGGNLTEKQFKYLNIINNNTQILSALLDKLIIFSTAESTQYKIEPSKFDVTQLLKDVINELQPYLSNNNIRLNLNNEHLSSFNIYSCSKTLKIIFENLLETVIQMNKDTVADILLSDNNNLTITIIDSSNGISSEELEYIDNPYITIQKNKKDLIRAFSLGTVKELVKKLNGTFEITSELQVGNKFNIVIPIEKRENE